MLDLGHCKVIFRFDHTNRNPLEKNTVERSRSAKRITDSSISRFPTTRYQKRFLSRTGPINRGRCYSRRLNRSTSHMADASAQRAAPGKAGKIYGNARKEHVQAKFSNFELQQKSPIFQKKIVTCEGTKAWSYSAPALRICFAN